MRMTDLSVSWLGLMLGAGAWGDCRCRAKCSMAEPARGGYESVSAVLLLPSKGTYIGCVDRERPDVRPSEGRDGRLVLSGVADNVDDEASPLHVQRKRFGQGQGRRTCNDDHLCAAAIPRLLGSPRLA